MKVRYHSNNSGGSWWLTDSDWFHLEASGWVVEWFRDTRHFGKGDRFLGALASSATRTGLSLEDAIAEFETITGACSTAEGCPCCGQPHEFYEESE